MLRGTAHARCAKITATTATERVDLGCRRCARAGVGPCRMARMVLKRPVDRAALLRPLPQERQTTDLLTEKQRATGSAHMTHRHYGVPLAKPRPTYLGETRAAAWSGGAIVGGIITIVIVLGFVVYEVSK